MTRENDRQLLQGAPHSVADAQGVPQFGTCQGGLDAVALSSLRGAFQPGALKRFVSHKKWLYGFLATDEVAAIFAVVDLGYSSNAFVLAYDFKAGHELVDLGLLGLPGPGVRLNDFPGAGLEFSFLHPRGQWHAQRARQEDAFRGQVVAGWPGDRARLESQLTPVGAPPLTVIAPVDGGIVNVTQKWAGLLGAGRLQVAGRTYSLEGAAGGLDYTQGYLARETAWRWAFVCGRLPEIIHLDNVPGVAEDQSVRW